MLEQLQVHKTFTNRKRFNTQVFAVRSVTCMLCCTASSLTQLMQLGLNLSLFLVLILCAQTAEFNKVTNMFRKRVFRLSCHDTTEAKMTSEQKKRQKLKELSPITNNQSNKQSKTSCLLHKQSKLLQTTIKTMVQCQLSRTHTGTRIP